MSVAPFNVFIVEDNDWYNKLLVHSVSLNPDIPRQFAQPRFSDAKPKQDSDRRENHADEYKRFANPGHGGTYRRGWPDAMPRGETPAVSNRRA